MHDWPEGTIRKLASGGKTKIGIFGSSKEGSTNDVLCKPYVYREADTQMVQGRSESLDFGTNIDIVGAETDGRGRP